jgi:hypothetical protein
MVRCGALATITPHGAVGILPTVRPPLPKGDQLCAGWKPTPPFIPTERCGALTTITPMVQWGILPTVRPPLRRCSALRGLEAHATIHPHALTPNLR